MPTQRFDDARLAVGSTSLLSPRLHSTTLLSPRLEMSSYAAPLTPARVTKHGAICAETEWPAEAFVNLRDLRRGVSWALGIEGAAALSFYAVWYLWHLWR